MTSQEIGAATTTGKQREDGLAAVPQGYQRSIGPEREPRGLTGKGHGKGGAEPQHLSFNK